MSFADLTASLDQEVLDHLGDAVTFISAEGDETSVTAFIDEPYITESFGAVRATVPDYSISFLKADVPLVQEQTQVRIPNHSEPFFLKNRRSDDSGKWWTCDLTRMPGRA